MKTVIILETDHLGLAVSDLLNPKEMKLIGIGNSDSDTWNVFREDNSGELKEEIEGLPIMPIDLAVGFQPDLLVIAAKNEEKSHALRYMAIRAGFENDIVFVNDIRNQFTVQGAVIRRISRRIQALGLDGDIAELGCYQGDTSWQLNALFPEKTLYLFDTMEGPDPRDLQKEEALGFSIAPTEVYEKNKEDYLLSRLPHKDQAIFKKGWFPETAFDLEDRRFSFVFIDAGLYQPTLAGLEFFFPRMVQGGMILISNYENPESPSIQKAVQDFEEKYGAFLILPLGDLSGGVVIVHP